MPKQENKKDLSKVGRLFQFIRI